jgi:hypothetical protein
MSLRLLAANLHDWLQRRVRFPFGPDPDSALRFAWFVVLLAFIGFILLMSLCAGSEGGNPTIN